ncbi:MAG: hypothetical protein ACRDJT_01290 [Actinomycetota bacterium]
MVDWRAPVAAPFIEPRFATPSGSGDEAGSLSKTGDCCSPSWDARFGDMRDIVATIQAEQDQIIRWPAADLKQSRTPSAEGRWGLSRSGRSPPRLSTDP